MFSIQFFVVCFSSNVRFCIFTLILGEHFFLLMELEFISGRVLVLLFILGIFIEVGFCKENDLSYS